MIKNEDKFENYMREQAEVGGSWFAVPWLSLASGLKDTLNSQYEGVAIPHLVLLSPDGEIVCKNGRDAVLQDQSGMMFPWIAE